VPLKDGPTDRLGIPALLDGKRNPAYHAAYYEQHRARLRVAQRAYQKNRRGRKLDHQAYRKMLLSFLFAKDGGNCWICGKPVAWGDESVDHVIPRCRGGPDEHTNLRLAHRVCNLRRSRSGPANS